MNTTLSSGHATPVGAFSAYSDYRNTNISYLAQLPAHWGLRRLKLMARVRPSNVDKKTVEGEVPVKLCNYVDVYNNESITSDLEFMEATATAAQIAHFSLRAGDVILTKDSESWQDIAVPAFVPHTLQGVVCGYHLVLVRPDPGRINPEYLFRCFSSSAINHQFQVTANGVTRFGCTADAFQNAWIPVPPVSEQLSITQFVKRETTKINAVIAKQEHLMRLLDERRRSLITRTVTGGITSRAKQRDSGVPELGAIPLHWSVKPLMRITAEHRPIMYGIVLPGPNVEDGVPIVKGGDVCPERLKLAMLNRTTREIEAGYVRSRLRRGDIVYAIRGSIGMAEIIPDEVEGANLTQDAARVSPMDGVDRRWLLYALKSQPVFAQLDSRAFGATIRGVNIRDLKRALIPVPPPDEQTEIACFLDEQVGRLDAIIQKARQQITRLQEHRTALITAAVTGQIDVRRA